MARDHDHCTSTLVFQLKLQTTPTISAARKHIPTDYSTKRACVFGIYECIKTHYESTSHIILLHLAQCTEISFNTFNRLCYKVYCVSLMPLKVFCPTFTVLPPLLNWGIVSRLKYKILATGFRRIKPAHAYYPTKQIEKYFGSGCCHEANIFF